MSKVAARSQRFVILDSGKTPHKQLVGCLVTFCRTEAQIEEIYKKNATGRIWISYGSDVTDCLVKTAARLQSQALFSGVLKGESLLTVRSPRPESMPMIRGLFGNIFGDSPQYRWLPREELLAVLMSDDAQSEVFIAAASDPVTQTVSLLRGDRRSMVVPFSHFKSSGDGIHPDFTQIAVADYGRTVSFGGYEAASDAILYELDPDYRKKLLKKRKEADRSFGASLRRLRKQKRLTQNAFAPLTSKTIARIESNTTGKPQQTTLQVLANRLGVKPEEIETY